MRKLQILVPEVPDLFFLATHRRATTEYNNKTAFTIRRAEPVTVRRQTKIQH